MFGSIGENFINDQAQNNNSFHRNNNRFNHRTSSFRRYLSVILPSGIINYYFKFEVVNVIFTMKEDVFRTTKKYILNATADDLR